MSFGPWHNLVHLLAGGPYGPGFHQWFPDLEKFPVHLFSVAPARERRLARSYNYGSHLVCVPTGVPGVRLSGAAVRITMMARKTQARRTSVVELNGKLHGSGTGIAISIRCLQTEVGNLGITTRIRICNAPVSVSPVMLVLLLVLCLPSSARSL